HRKGCKPAKSGTNGPSRNRSSAGAKKSVHTTPGASDAWNHSPARGPVRGKREFSDRSRGTESSIARGKDKPGKRLLAGEQAGLGEKKLPGSPYPGSRKCQCPSWAGQGRGICSQLPGDRKSTRLNSSHVAHSYAVFCLKKKTYPYSTP